MASAGSFRNLPRVLTRPNARPFSSASIRRTSTCHFLHEHRFGHQSILAAKSQILQPSIFSRPATSPLTVQNRTFVELKPTGGKTEADLIVEELQELYNDAKDEFEIAVDSTNSATIYAASDRDSAREYLNQLLYVYTAYTFPKDGPAPDAEDPSVQLTSPMDQEPNFDPESVTAEVREEVKKRVGQRIRELRSGVERLEDMAGHEG